MGDIYSRAGASACDVCPAGNFTSLSEPDEHGAADGVDEGATHCLSCPAGRFSILSNASCEPCAAGTARDTVGGASASDCSDCEPGLFAPADGGALSCTLCSAGRYAAGSRSTECVNCEAGRYSSDVGASACEECPLARRGKECGVYDRDCVGQWSACTSECTRTWTETEPQAGEGQACPSSPACRSGEDQCPQHCEGSWSTCNADCADKLFTVRVNASLHGRPCEAVQGASATCAEGEDECFCKDCPELIGGLKLLLAGAFVAIFTGAVVKRLSESMVLQCGSRASRGTIDVGQYFFAETFDSVLDVFAFFHSWAEDDLTFQNDAYQVVAWSLGVSTAASFLFLIMECSCGQRLMREKHEYALLVYCTHLVLDVFQASTFVQVAWSLAQVKLGNWAIWLGAGQAAVFAGVKIYLLVFGTPACFKPIESDVESGNSTASA